MKALGPSNYIKDVTTKSYIEKMVFVVKISNLRFICDDHHRNYKVLIIISENPEHIFLKLINNSLS